MKSDNGFSLLELLIAVALVVIIAVIAIPSLLKSRQAANEASAVANLRRVEVAQVGYASENHGHYGSIEQLVSAGLLDDRFNRTMSGYDYSVSLSPDTLDYTTNAIARSSNDGRFDYYFRPDNVIRYSMNPTRAPADLSGQPTDNSRPEDPAKVVQAAVNQGRYPSTTRVPTGLPKDRFELTTLRFASSTSPLVSAPTVDYTTNDTASPSNKARLTKDIGDSTDRTLAPPALSGPPVE